MAPSPTSGNANSRKLPWADRHSQLVDLAEELFIARGYAAVSMEDISRAAGVSRPVVYDHFKTKEGAYLACVRRARTAYQAEVLELVDPGARPLEQVRAGGEAFFSMLERDPGRWRLLFGSNAVLPGEATHDLARLRFGTIEQVHELLVAGAPSAPPERLEALAHVISGAAERLGHWWLTRPDLSRTTIVEHYVEIVWDGLHPYVPEDVTGESPLAGRRPLPA